MLAPTGRGQKKKKQREDEETLARRSKQQQRRKILNGEKRMFKAYQVMFGENGA